MKDCHRNKSCYEHKVLSKAKASPAADMDTQRILMVEEMKRKNSSTNLLKAYLKAVRPKRLKDAKQQCAADHIRDYPAFRKPSLVSPAVSFSLVGARLLYGPESALNLVASANELPLKSS